MKWTWDKLKTYNHQKKNKKFLKEFNELMNFWKILEDEYRDKMIIANKNKCYFDESNCYQILRELQRNRHSIETLINNFYA